jgi:hypothetical protein
MNRLERRLAKLEEARGTAELPNGGMLVVLIRPGETRGAALCRTASPTADPSHVRHLWAGAQRRLIPVFMAAADAAL